MDTFEEQQAFFQRHWPQMKSAAESGGAPAVIELVEGLDSRLERRVLYVFARTGLAMDDWQGKNFDVLIGVCQAGMRELVAQGEATEDPEVRKRRIDTANVISYNLAADLADCWPGDETPRTRAHFEAGLQASEDCIRWREQLEKGPWPRSMAFWTRGMHQLSLGDVTAAGDSWRTSLDYAIEGAAEQDGATTSVTADGDFAVILGSGYLGLAQWMQGDRNGRSRYDEAIAAFKAQLADESKKDDAQFGIVQLEKVRTRYMAP